MHLCVGLAKICGGPWLRAWRVAAAVAAAQPPSGILNRRALFGRRPGGPVAEQG
jgi:hypothetical protein